MNLRMNFSLGAAAAIFLAVAVGCTSRTPSSSANAQPTKDLTNFDFTVSPDPEWTDIFHRTHGWFGGDGIFAIPLSPLGTPAGEDSALFIFSDTMVGDIVDGEVQPGFKMVNNSVAYLHGKTPDATKIKFYYDVDKDGRPETIFKPKTPNAGPRDYYWLGDGFLNRKLNKIFIFAYRMRNMSGEDWSFKQVGNAIITLDPKSKPPYKDQRQTETPFLISAAEEQGSGSLGAGIFDNTKEAGAPDPDGYVYVYGVRGKGNNLIVSRVKPEDFESFGKWRFWNGSSWVSGIENAAFVTNRVSNELSVSPLSDGRYALVFQVDGLSTTVGMRLGESPYGPFGPVIKVWNCTEPQQKNYITYNAKAYPHYSKPGELLISYNVNAFDFLNEMKANPTLYRPRFIRLKYK